MKVTAIVIKIGTYYIIKNMFHSKFAKSKGIEIIWLDNELGHMQRAFQTIRELLYNQNEKKKLWMLKDFSVRNKVGVEAAKKLISDDFIAGRSLRDITVEEVFDALMKDILR